MKTRIGIIDDQSRILNNLITRFTFFEDIEIIMTAANAEDCLKKLEKLNSSQLPQVLLVDIEMPGKSGIELTRILNSKHPGIDIIIQTVFEDEDKIFKSVLAGASGYLLKDDPIQKYVNAIHDLMNDGAALSPSVASKLMQYVKSSIQDREEKAKESQEKYLLTDREIEILKGIADDLTEHQIGEKLFISHHTVRTHIKNIYKKLHVHSRASAVKLAISQGLVT